jgi:hypothetical protein
LKGRTLLPQPGAQLQNTKRPCQALKRKIIDKQMKISHLNEWRFADYFVKAAIIEIERQIARQSAGYFV